MNEVKLIGRLGANAEIRYTASGNPITSFNLAVSKPFKKDGKWEHDVIWIQITCWKEYQLSKGTEVFVSGRLDVQKWEDAEGNKRQTTKVVAKTIKEIKRREKHEKNDSGPNDDIPF